jgi:outer membrane lipoprotein-sorting protein
MRRFVCLAVALAVVAAGAARAEKKEEKTDCKAVIEKAIKAAGGEEKLAKAKAFTFKMKGKFYGMGEGIDYTGEVAIQLPDKSRVKIDGEIDNKKVTFFTAVTNGDKVWRKMGDGEAEQVTDKDKLAEAKEERYAERVISLLPLVKEKDFKLEPLGEAKVDGKPAVGVKVSQKGHRDVNLFFDKDSGFLVKSERTVKDEQTDKELTEERIYSDYKESGGIKRFTKMVMNRDGKKYVEAEISDFEVKDKIDDAEFGKP